MIFPTDSLFYLVFHQSNLLDHVDTAQESKKKFHHVVLRSVRITLVYFVFHMAY